MKPRRFIHSLALAGVCLLLASCIDSKNPLCSPEDAKGDAEFVGIWRAKSGDGSVEYYHVALAAGKLPPGVMRAVTVGYDKHGMLSRPGEILVFSTVMGENRYLNIAMVDAKDLSQFEQGGWKAELVKGYLIVKYQVQGDTLTLWGMDPNTKRRAIEAGTVKGTIEKNATFFTDTPENLAKFLAAPENADLFAKKPVKYERVK